MLKARLRRRVIVTTKTGDAFAGVLFEADANAWVLREAEVLAGGPNRGNLPVDGELLVLAADVAYVQMP